MRQELYEALVRDFPLTFESVGFECSDGWEPIIRKAAEKLEPLIKKDVKLSQKNPDEYYVRPGASQIKEKYGTLRFYLTCGSDEMFKIVDEAERASQYICEECGKPGKLSGPGWLKTVCEEHLGNSVYILSRRGQ